MGSREPSPHDVLRLLVARVTGENLKELAKQLNYTNAHLSVIAGKYRLPEIEQKIRYHITGQVAQIPPEALMLNTEYDKQLKKIGDEISNLAEDGIGAEIGFDSNLDKMRFLDVAAKGLENVRQSRLKIAMLSDGQKKQSKPPDTKTSYNDLIDDDDDEA